MQNIGRKKPLINNGFASLQNRICYVFASQHKVTFVQKLNQNIKCLEIAHLETNKILLVKSRIEQTFIVACTDY